MTGIVFSLMAMAMISMVITRPGIATTIRELSALMAGSIRAMLGMTK